MSLQPGRRKIKKVNSITSVSGYDENADGTDSDIPWVFDDWFYGDFKTSRPKKVQ